jgi:PAS domain S-box-containing protein
MEDKTRNSGIDVIGNVPWGTHFCQFYKTKQDLIDILVPYFKAGLEDNEFCMWVTSEPLILDEAQEAMKGAVAGFDEYLRRGQIEIIPYDEWYLLGGTFDDDRVLDGWVNKLEQALAKGYAGLRLTGNTFWLERNHWQAFTEYEAKVNNVIGRYQMMAACTYNLDRCDGTAVIDVVKNHQFALVKQEGKWDIIESAIYKQAKDALHLSEERFRAIYEESPIGIKLYDADGKLIMANQACLDIFGTSEADVRELKLFEDPDLSDKAKEKLRRGEAVRHEFPFDYGKVKKQKLYETSRSDTIYVDAIIAPLGLREGTLGGYLVQVQDITERKKVEDLKDAFIGMVSHELKTPLTVINGCLSTVLTEWERLPSGEVQQLLQDAVLEGEYLSHLVENLLELSRFQAQQLTLYVEPVNTNVIVADTLNKMKRQVQSHRFVASIPDDLILVQADPLRMERILYNLLENAVKYSSPGSQIKVSAAMEPERLVIGVQDRGRGLSASEQAKLFTPFWRLEDARPDRARGAGLGLMVCRVLVEAHGGEIWVESKKGRGSTFLFSLPAGKDVRK